MSYCIYLRKSRADKELCSEEEVLKRHETTLLELAKNRSYNITKIFREVVSGETLAARPQMQQLLSEVENGLWEGVLVMEVERLARGNSVDQGIVAQAFKYSNTLIITPTKTYNPTNEFDEEYFEFGLFMSRREYKTINRRLNAGRIAACKEGKYAGGNPPYGFDKEKLKGERGWKLIPIPEEIEIVKLIYKLYLSDEDGTGFSGIARRLNDSKVPTRSGVFWTSTQVKKILTNDVYIGKIHWQKVPEKKIVENGVLVKRRYINSNPLIFEGLHDAVIDEDIFNRVQEIVKSRKKPPNTPERPMQNPFAGVLVCAVCGKPLKRRPPDKRRPGHSPSFDCITPYCPTISSPVNIVENRILDGMKMWLEDYKLKENNNNIVATEYSYNTTRITNCKKELENIQKQLGKTYTLLEQGIYDNETFLERQVFLKNEMSNILSTITKLEEEDNATKARAEYNKTLIPELENLLEVYDTLPDAKSKNVLIKKIFHQIRYSKKTRGNRWAPDKVDDFELEFISKLPSK